jgi:hypothetical protein
MISSALVKMSDVKRQDIRLLGKLIRRQALSRSAGKLIKRQALYNQDRPADLSDVKLHDIRSLGKLADVKIIVDEVARRPLHSQDHQ